MDLRKLESFVEIAKQKSFTRAAERLYLTQPTLTGHIQSLENELGTVLFNRYGKEVTLTEAGSILYKHAVNILNMKEQAYYSMSRYKGKLEGELAIAASTVPQKCLLPGLLTAFSGKFPDIRYDIKQLDSKGVVDSIISGNMDFGFVGTVPSYSELKMFKICEEQLMLITPVGGKYSGLKGNSIAWEQIKDERFILREEGSATRELFLNALSKKGKRVDNLNIIANIESHDTIKRCVREGLGVAIVSEQIDREDIKSGLLRGFYISDFDMHREFYFINHKNRVLNPVTRAFREFARKYFRNAP